MRTLIRFSLLLLVVLMGVLPTFVSAHEENTGRTRELIAQYLDAINANDADTLMSITSDDYMHYQPGTAYTRDEILGRLGALVAAMPDFHMTPELILADGDWGALRVQVSGTFTNDMAMGEMTLPANNAQVVAPIHFIIHVNEDGQINEVWEMFDNLGFLMSIGAIPAMEGMEMPMSEVLPQDTPLWEIMEMSDENMETTRSNVTRVVDEFFNAGDSSVVGELISDDVLIHPDEIGREEFIQGVEAFRAAMPDFAATADPIIVDGNWFAFHYTGEGTFSSDLVSAAGSVPPTGQPFMYEAIIIGRLDENGILVEEWDAFDNLSTGMQLGLIPMPDA